MHVQNPALRLLGYGSDSFPFPGIELCEPPTVPKGVYEDDSVMHVNGALDSRASDSATHTSASASRASALCAPRMRLCIVFAAHSKMSLERFRPYGRQQPGATGSGRQAFKLRQF